jgi:hypothetical protein
MTQKIFALLLAEFGKENQLEIRPKQVYAYWMELNQKIWRMKDDQIASAQAYLAKHDGQEIDMIPLDQESGIMSMAFSIRCCIKLYGKKTEEIAMDSTCKRTTFV